MISWTAINYILKSSQKNDFKTFLHSKNFLFLFTFLRSSQGKKIYHLHYTYHSLSVSTLIFGGLKLVCIQLETANFPSSIVRDIEWYSGLISNINMEFSMGEYRRAIILPSRGRFWWSQPMESCYWHLVGKSWTDTTDSANHPTESAPTTRNHLALHINSANAERP